MMNIPVQDEGTAMDHRDQAEQHLAYADAQVTGNAQAMLLAALTHAVIALVDRLDEMPLLVAISE